MIDCSAAPYCAEYGVTTLNVDIFYDFQFSFFLCDVITRVALSLSQGYLETNGEAGRRPRHTRSAHGSPD
jgi:hypothetical protein